MHEQQDHFARRHQPSQAWIARYNRIKTISDSLGRLPRRSDDVPSADIDWIADQRRSTTLSEQQRTQLAKLPGWDTQTRDGAWYERADQLATFITDQGRLPRARAASPLERGLAHWLSRQRAAQRQDSLSDERASALAYALRALGA